MIPVTLYYLFICLITAFLLIFISFFFFWKNQSHCCMEKATDKISLFSSMKKFYTCWQIVTSKLLQDKHAAFCSQNIKVQGHLWGSISDMCRCAMQWFIHFMHMDVEWNLKSRNWPNKDISIQLIFMLFSLSCSYSWLDKARNYISILLHYISILLLYSFMLLTWAFFFRDGRIFHLL